jgi:hypothetical protein
MPNPDPSPETRFKKGNQAQFKHGGEAAIKALQHGGSLVGITRRLQNDVHDQIQSEGILAVMLESAERYQAVANLFYGLILGTKDIAEADKYAARYGWLASKAFRMLETVHKLEQAGGPSDMLELAIEAAKRSTDRD